VSFLFAANTLGCAGTIFLAACSASSSSNASADAGGDAPADATKDARAVLDASPIVSTDADAPLYGCSSFLSCVAQSTSPVDQAACEANSTQRAKDLLKILLDCLARACGAPKCTGPSDQSPTCNTCLRDATASVCRDDYQACQADLP
jgi:hypothetical protein